LKHCERSCGDCYRCRAIKKALADAHTTARLLRKAMTLLESCRWDLNGELSVNDPRDIRQNPQLRTKVGLVYRIDKLTRQVESK
jgi:hypothetical protein